MLSCGLHGDLQVRTANFDLAGAVLRHLLFPVKAEPNISQPSAVRSKHLFFFEACARLFFARLRALRRRCLLTTRSLFFAMCLALRSFSCSMCAYPVRIHVRPEGPVFWKATDSRHILSCNTAATAAHTFQVRARRAVSCGVLETLHLMLSPTPWRRMATSLSCNKSRSPTQATSVSNGQLPLHPPTC